MQYTSNDDAYEDYGNLSSEGGWSGMLSRLAFCAMQADVRDALRDLEDEEPEEEEEEAGVDDDTLAARERAYEEARTAGEGYALHNNEEALRIYMSRAHDSWLATPLATHDWLEVWTTAGATTQVLRDALYEEYGTNTDNE